MKRFALIVFVALGFAPLAALVLAVANYDWLMAQDWYHSANIQVSGCVLLVVQMLLYIRVIGKNMLITDVQRKRWRILVFLFSPVMMPMYNIKYLIPFLFPRHAKPEAP